LIFAERKTVDFHHKIYVAPLTTVGNLPFRRVMKDFGTDITCGEMAVSGNILKGSPSEWALLRRHKCEDVYGVQVAGGDHRMMDRLAQVLENEIKVDFVDLNMGCPLDFICNKGMGSKLMLRERRIKQIVTNMTTRLSVPMTLKLRTGWSNDKPMAHSLLKKIPLWNIEFGQDRLGGPAIQAVTIHGRSRLQRYKNLADWDFIRGCSRDQQTICNELLVSSSTTDSTTTSSTTNATPFNETDRPVPRAAVIGNGDVYSFTDWNRELASGELDTCMLARGALIKPWLPKEIKEQRHWDISATERLDVMKDFVKYGLDYWGSDESGVSRCRRFMLEWLSFLYRYIPIGLLERMPHQMNERPPRFFGRNDLETMLASNNSLDWVALTTMAGLPPPKADYKFTPKHRANAYSAEDQQKQIAAVSVLHQESEQSQKDAAPPSKKQKVVHDPASN
jgi:tRNA-dihydrouridine synthase 3